MSGIDKLFSERVEYFGLVDGSHSGILMSIVKVLVKVHAQISIPVCISQDIYYNMITNQQSLIEEVRMVTLNRAGFHQMQLDIEYLRMHLW